MFSMFWGVILYGVFYHLIPLGGYIPILKSPLVGVVVFSFVAMLVGGLLRNWTNKIAR